MLNPQSSKLIHNVLVAHRSQIGFTDALLELEHYVEDLERENNTFLEVGKQHQSKLHDLVDKLEDIMKRK